uniref:Uncharacterized protein n=1 Tax=Arundo donax TaxID=35708 RepID=A0A0A9AMQ0_ARUDO
MEQFFCSESELLQVILSCKIEEHEQGSCVHK